MTNLWSYNYSNDLYHHGVKGMKWGVRRYRKLNGTLTAEGKQRYKDDIVYKKGTEFQHISANSKLKLSKKQTYVSQDDWDKAVYAGQYALELAYVNRTDSIFNYTYKATKDLVSPSQQKRVDMFVDMYKKNPARVGKELTKAMDLASKNDDSLMTNRLKGKWDVTDYKNASDSQIRSGYEVFKAMNGEADTAFKKSYAIKKYNRNLRKEGYNAIIDDNDAGFYYNAKSPIIVTNGRKSLKKTHSYKMTPDEIHENIKRTNRKRR